MTSLGGGTMWITPHDPPPGSAPSLYLQDGRQGETLGDGCTMWTTTLAPPPGNAQLLRTSGKSPTHTHLVRNNSEVINYKMTKD